MRTRIGSIKLFRNLNTCNSPSHNVKKVIAPASLKQATRPSATQFQSKQRAPDIERRKWLPPDDKAFLFTFIVLIYLAAALIHFFTSGDGSMLTVLLECVGTYAGIQTITKHISSSQEKKKSDALQSGNSRQP